MKYRLRTVTLHVQDSIQGTAPNSPEQACEFLRPIFASLDADREHFVMLTLDAQNHVRGFKLLSTGSMTESIVDAKTLFRDALLLGAVHLILCHNHPSGDPTPSPADRTLTRRLVEAGKLLDIRIHDHIILGEGHLFLSMAQAGLL